MVIEPEVVPWYWSSKLSV